VVLLAAVAAFTLPASKAAAQVNEQHVPVTATFLNPCTGELLTGSGFAHFRTSFTSTPNFHGSVELNLEGFQATTPLGVRYVVPEEISQNFVFDRDFAPEHENFEDMLHLIRQGEDGTFVLGDDFYLRDRTQFTINANGVVTVDNFESTATCN